MIILFYIIFGAAAVLFLIGAIHLAYLEITLDEFSAFKKDEINEQKLEN